MTASARPARARKSAAGVPVVERLIVEGYKAHRDRVELDLRPLTVLCGANSSGKSSVMQALLLLKQTAGSELVGPELRLDGPHVLFENFHELVWRRPGTKIEDRPPLRLGLVVDGCEAVSTVEARGKQLRPEVTSTAFGPWKTLARAEMVVGADADMQHLVDNDDLSDMARALLRDAQPRRSAIQFVARRGFVDGAAELMMWVYGLELETFRRPRPKVRDVGKLTGKEDGDLIRELDERESLREWTTSLRQDLHQRTATLQGGLAAVLHLPGLRGVPQRRYSPDVPSSQSVAVPFTQVFAGLLQRWQDGDAARLGMVAKTLQAMGLAWKVATKVENLTSVNLSVSRTPASARGSAQDLVALPDVGFGVSQVLPVVVALVFAVPGQLVYLEQPELHLHPRAVEGLANAIVDATRRGVRVVVETHSETMLVAFQLAIAEERLPSGDAIFHWFRRDDVGAAKVTTSAPDDSGRLGDWPADFGDSMMGLQGRFITKVSERARRHGGG